MSWWKLAGIVSGTLVLAGIGYALYFTVYAEFDIYVPRYANQCAGCHGSELNGTEHATALVGIELSHGDSVDELQRSIRQRHDWPEPLDDLEVKGLAIFVGERRLGQRFTDFRYEREISIPAGIQRSELHAFSISTLTKTLDPLVFSIAPLPDGSILLTEKERGLSIVSAAGEQSEPIAGTPTTGGSFDLLGIQFGSGWLLDVALHPNFETNGWIYLHYTDICPDDCGSGVTALTMNRLDRGRINNGKWVDVETIWQAPREFYLSTPDTGSGGRIAFDAAGHVFISTGIKSADGLQDTTAQDLSNPFGKIHRVLDDGTVPLDNPFTGANHPADGRASIWTFGHRSPQGLEWHPLRGRVWNSEMGPRGGDELNELLAGRNYGWPYFSEGLEYLGGRVERHKAQATEFDASEVEQTLVNITPSPAISSFVFYAGDRFPHWQHNVLIGSLKGGSLFRMEFDGNRFLRQETLLKDIARIRDIEVGFDGLIYLLLENKAGGAIVRLSPAPTT